MNLNKHDLSDDELDHLFRDSAEKVAFNFDPNSWTKMSQKLDAANLPASSQNQVKNTWLKRSLLLLLALFFLAGTYYFTTQKTNLKTTIQTTDVSNQNKVTIKEKSEKNKVENSNLKTKESVTPKEDIISNNSLSTSYENKKLENANKSKLDNEYLANKKEVITSEIQENTITKNDVPVNTLTNKTLPKSDKRLSNTTKPSAVLSNKKSPESSLMIDENAVSEKTKIEEKSNENLSRNTTQVIENISQTTLIQSTENKLLADTEQKTERWQLANVKDLAFKSVVFKTTINLPIVAFESPKIVPTNIPKSTSFKKGLSIRLAYSPDFSVVPSNAFSRMGSNEAFLLEYRFDKHWSLQTGVIRSMKRYTATPEQYNWNMSWNNPTPLVDVHATCKMLDIPLNIRYDFTQKANSRLFASAGFTSYKMLNEYYHYNYKDDTNPNIKYRELTTKTGNYPFKVLNLSFGYERQILRKLTFQAEPFVKLSLGEMGYGTVNLATIGVFFSAKYQFDNLFRRSGQN